MASEKELRTLDDCRRRIDEIDAELVELLNERARVSEQVGRVKASNGTPIFAPSRESQVLEQVQQANAGPMPNAALRSIWIEILSASSALQRPLRVAYLVSASTTGVLPKTPMVVERGRLLLRFDNGFKALAGERVFVRLRQLARLIGREPVMETA